MKSLLRIFALAALGLFATMADAKAEDALPVGYTPIEYIQSTGAQKINTGLTVKGTTVIDAMCGRATFAQDNAMFGILWGGNSHMLVLYASSPYMRYWGGNTGVYSSVIDGKFRVQVDEKNVTITPEG